MRRDAYYQEHARALRSNMTHAEQILWSRLRAHRMDGHKFRRQHALGSYIADFVCLKARLVIEVDGETHDAASRQTLDTKRTGYLEKLGFRVLRFENYQIVEELDAVIEAISAALVPANAPLPYPLPPGGEGDIFLRPLRSTFGARTTRRCRRPGSRWWLWPPARRCG
jgi:5-methyltetrahydrofolate--homocysteine methyltransferase